MELILKQFSLDSAQNCSILNIEFLKYCYKTSFSTANSFGKRDA